MSTAIRYDNPLVHDIVTILYAMTIDIADHQDHDDDLFTCKRICWCGDDDCTTCGNDRPNLILKPLGLKFWWPKHPGSNHGFSADPVPTADQVKAAAKLVLEKVYDDGEYTDQLKEIVATP